MGEQILPQIMVIVNSEIGLVVPQFEKFVIPSAVLSREESAVGPDQSRFLTGKERRFGMTKCDAVQTEPL